MVQAHQLGRLLRRRPAKRACGMVCDTAFACRSQQHLPSLRFVAESSSPCSSSHLIKRGLCRCTSSDTYFNVDPPIAPVGWSVTPLSHSSWLYFAIP